MLKTVGVKKKKANKAQTEEKTFIQTYRNLHSGIISIARLLVAPVPK